MWIYDLESLSFLAVNDAAIEHYGYSRDEFLGMTIAAIRPREDVAALLDNVAHVTTGLDHAGVWRHRTRDGTTIDVEITSHVVDWAGRNAELVMAVDVTSRRRAEATLRASERRFALAFRTSPALMSLTRVSDRVLVDVSDSLARLTGFTREEMIGRTSAGLGLWADPDEATLIREEIAAHGALLDRELRLRTRGGEMRAVVAAFNIVEVDGDPCVLGTGIDITDRRAAEELALRQKAQLEHLLASSPTTLYTLRLEDAALFPTFVSDNLQRVLGYTTEEVSHAGFFACHDFRPVPLVVRAGKLASHMSNFVGGKAGLAGDPLN